MQIFEVVTSSKFIN